MDPIPVLLQFTASHYNEKARWALDWKRVSYARRSLLPGLHAPRVWLRTGQRAVPVLVLGRRAIADSSRIIETLEREHPDPPLYPADPRERARALELEEFFDTELGPHVRRVAFHALLGDGDYFCALFAQEAGPLARRAYRAFFPVTRSLIERDLRIDAERAEASRARMDAAFERLEKEIGPSGYLVGDRFSVADLAAAALATPIVQPPEFPHAWPSALPEPLRRLREAYASSAAFRWVRDVYRRQRGSSSAITRSGGA